MLSYLHGCNYPWSADGDTAYYGLDFGANVWGSHLGVSTRRAAVTRDFAEMAALGFTCTRWFLFCDGRAGIVYDDRGLPIGPDPHLFADVDAALETARDVGMRIDFVLLDHRWMFAGVRHTIADPATGVLLEARLPEGRSRVLLSAAGRDGLFERVIEPLVRRYGRAGERADLAPAILAYEFMNEPDFVIEEWERDLSPRVSRPLPFEALATLVSRLSDLVHAEHTDVLTTIGCARVHNLWAWDDDAMGLDVLQVHSYPDARSSGSGAARVLPPSPRLRRTAEAPAEAGSDPPDITLGAHLDFALNAGYAGAWPWSFSGTDAYGRLPAEPLRRFATAHPELVNPRARSPQDTLHLHVPPRH